MLNSTYLFYLLLIVFYLSLIAGPHFKTKNRQTFFLALSLSSIFVVCSSFVICEYNCIYPFTRDSIFILNTLATYDIYISKLFFDLLGFCLIAAQFILLRRLGFSYQSIIGFLTLAIPTLGFNQIRESFALTVYLFFYESKFPIRFILPPMLHPALLVSFLFDIKSRFHRYNFLSLIFTLVLLVFFIFFFDNIKNYFNNSTYTLPYFGAFFLSNYFRYENFKVGITLLGYLAILSIYFRNFAFFFFGLLIYISKFYINQFIPSTIIERYIEILLIFVWLNYSKNMNFSILTTTVLYCIFTYRLLFNFMQIQF